MDSSSSYISWPLAALSRMFNEEYFILFSCKFNAEEIDRVKLLFHRYQTKTTKNLDVVVGGLYTLLIRHQHC